MALKNDVFTAIPVILEQERREDSQPKSISENEKQNYDAIGKRKPLPDERLSITHKFNVGGYEGYLIVGLYPNGNVGEIFIKMSKKGSTLSGLMDAFAVAVSVALQYGVPLEVYIDKFRFTNFEPNGFTTNPEIPVAKSIIDYIFRWLENKFLNKNGEKSESNGGIKYTPISDEQKENEETKLVNTGLSCPNCGNLTVQAGSCRVCTECGTTTGCS